MLPSDEQTPQETTSPAPAEAAQESLVNRAESAGLDLDIVTPQPATDEQSPAKPEFNVRTGVNPNAELAKAVRSVLPDKFKGQPLDATNSLALLGAEIEELEYFAGNYKNMGLSRDQSTYDWLQAVDSASVHGQRGDGMLGALQREGSYWRQQVVGPGGELLGAGRPAFGEGSSEPGGRLVGPQAMMKIRGLLDLGTIARIPLWHSGLWISFKAPSEASLLELERRISMEKVLMGRRSDGKIFSHASVYTNMHLVNFALEHAYETTYRQVSNDELKKKILMSDIPQLIWGLLCTIYPNGYPYKQPCITEPAKCTHVVDELLDLTKLSWTDDRALTPWQRQQMTRRTSKFTDEEIKRYQDEHKFNDEIGTVKLHDGLNMVLKVPTVAEFESSGHAWISELTSKVDEAFGGKLSATERSQFISDAAATASLRQYSHWISKLVFTDGSGVIDTQADIEDAISALTSAQETVDTFHEGMRKYIANTTITIIGFPKYNCPKCGTPQTVEESKHPHLVALDVTSIFFTLLGQRLTKILSNSGL